MATYQESLQNDKKFVGNVVVRFLGRYFTLRAPDAGLITRDAYQGLVASLVLNPTTVDPKRVSTTIASYSIKMIDRNGTLSRLVKDSGVDLVNQTVEIWLGRNLAAVGDSMDFADYYKLPVTRIKRYNFQDGAYTFSTTEETDRMNRSIFVTKTRLSGDILAATNALTVKDDISGFASSGYLRIDDEFLGYTSKDNGAKTFSGLTRGEFNTLPADHSDNADIFVATNVEVNPVTLLLQLLISGGGGGAYDVLPAGLGIAPSLIDLDEIEGIRDELFSSVEFRLGLYNISNALQFIEREILAPCNLRFTYSINSKLTLVVLDRARFVETTDIIDEDTLTKNPSVSVDDNKIVNVIEIDWGYSELTGKYEQRSTFRNEDSIAAYGEKTSINFKFKGVQADLDGEDFVDQFGNALLDRLSLPSAEISVNTQVDKSLMNVGGKTLLRSTKIANASGVLNFAEETEIVSRAINYQTGDVQIKLAFTSFTGVRSCYLAPSATFVSAASDSVGTLGAGKGDLWQAGWKVRLWDNVAAEYATTQVNEIESIDGDEITFVDPWDVTLSADHRLKFPDYDDATAEQKRYCFISPTGLDFSSTEKSYKIVP